MQLIIDYTCPTLRVRRQIKARSQPTVPAGGQTVSITEDWLALNNDAYLLCGRGKTLTKSAVCSRPSQIEDLIPWILRFLRCSCLSPIQVTTEVHSRCDPYSDAHEIKASFLQHRFTETYGFRFPCTSNTLSFLVRSHASGGSAPCHASNCSSSSPVNSIP